MKVDKKGKIADIVSSIKYLILLTSLTFVKCGKRMIGIKRIHHIAIICSNYEVSKKFYTEILGFKVLRETYREERKSHKLDLLLEGDYCVELFSFPSPPERHSKPEAVGLRHLAFEVENIEASIQLLKMKQIEPEPVRIDTLTNKKFTFFSDPDNMPIELYER